MQVLAGERTQGQYTRTLQLGDNLNTEELNADYEDGVLHLTIPVADKAKPRKVEVGVSFELTVPPTVNFYWHPSKADATPASGVLRRKHRTVGEFRYEVELPADFDIDNVTAGFQDGVLSVRLPKAAPDQPRHIPIN